MDKRTLVWAILAGILVIECCAEDTSATGNADSNEAKVDAPVANEPRGDVGMEPAESTENIPEGSPRPDGQVAEESDPAVCYVCNSKYDGEICNDPMTEDKLAQLEQKQCDAKAQQFACYKVKTSYTSLVPKEGGSEEVVLTSRMCATWDDLDSTSYMDGGTSTNTGAWRSFCSGDLCNAGHVVSASLVTWIFCASSLAALWLKL